MTLRIRVAHAAFVLVLVLALVLAPAALAGKGKGAGKPSGGSGSSSLSLVLLNSSDGLPHWGQQVTFKVSTSATSRPFVQLACYQGGIQVYSYQVGFFPSYPWSTVYTLSSNAWTAGAAACTAKLVYTRDGRRVITLATLKFQTYA
jgi:hypothetical protein